MPKVVDHDKRRAELGRAVWEVISRDGIESATVRKVAEEAGVSMGGLRHYFDSQQGLLEFAAQAVASSVGARLARHLGAHRCDMDGAQLMLEEFLPLDADRRVEVDVWLACLIQARTDDGLAELRRASWAGERHCCRVAAAYCTGARPPGTIGDELADDCLFMDGLTLQAVAYRHELSAEWLRGALRAELEHLFPPARPPERR